ncbi:MAG: hypothetical protein ACON4Z_16870 [Planctomycetota bacterium]
MTTVLRIRQFAALSALLSLLAVSACGGGGGNGGAQTGATNPNLPVSVPPGTGALTIDMAGTWTIQDAIVVETNAAVPNPPFNGTPMAFEPTRIASIGGLSVAPGDLAALIGSPLVSYVNVIDSSTVFYGLVVDQRASGGDRLETALAGGAVSANTIAVEAFNSTQSPSDPVPRFTRSRYVLVRSPGTTPLLHRPEDWTFGDLSRSAFGGF